MSDEKDDIVFWLDDIIKDAKNIDETNSQDVNLYLVEIIKTARKIKKLVNEVM